MTGKRVNEGRDMTQRDANFWKAFWSRRRRKADRPAFVDAGLVGTGVVLGLTVALFFLSGCGPVVIDKPLCLFNCGDAK